MKTMIGIILAFGLLQSGLTTRGQEVADPDTVMAGSQITVARSNGFPFFTEDEPLEMYLNFNMGEFLRTKDHPVYQDAVLTIQTAKNELYSQHIRIKARGNMRREYCSFPPVMMKFIRKAKDPNPIQDGGTLKLVTECNQSCTFQSYIFKEYLIYKMYNLVTPYSFKTRLVKIHFVDTFRPKNSYTAYGFLIENENDMAERNHAALVGKITLTENQMYSLAMARVAVFNYMIGNTDWSVSAQHNIKILRPMNFLSTKAIPVAYDFDYSGFVNTMYASPSQNLPLTNVRERYYKGNCMTDEELVPVLDEFGDLKGKFLQTIDECEYLSNGDKKLETSYINSFYKRLNKQNVLLSDINRTCKQL